MTEEQLQQAKLCPLLVIAGLGMAAQCKGQTCALWSEEHAQCGLINFKPPPPVLNYSYTMPIEFDSTGSPPTPEWEEPYRTSGSTPEWEPTTSNVPDQE